MDKFTIFVNKGNPQTNSPFQNTQRHNVKQMVLLFLLSLLSIFVSILFGASVLSLHEVARFFLGETIDSYVSNIMLFVRIPRALGGFLCGCALAVSGLLLQSSLNNSLASPSTIGVNAGAGFFVILSSIFFPMNLFMRTFFAFIGAIVISLLVYAISYITGRSKMTIILAGVAVTSLCNAIIDCIIILYPDSVFDKTAFYIGGLSGVNYNQLLFSLVFVIVALTIVLFLHKQLDILILGDEISSSLGISVNKIRFLIIISASLLAGASVSMAGLLGFVGLIVPHIATLLFENESKTLIPKTAMLGGIFVVWADLFARLMFAPFEIPVGIILSILGAPFFLYLLFRTKKK